MPLTLEPCDARQPIRTAREPSPCLVVQRFARLAHALLARAERLEVGSGLGHHVAKEAHHNAARGGAVNGNIEEHLRAVSGKATAPERSPCR